MLSPFRLVLTLCSVLGVLKEGQQLNGSAAAHDEIKGKVFPRAQSEQPRPQRGVGAQSWAPPPALPSQPRCAALREVPPALRRFPCPLSTPPSRSLPRCQGSPGCPVQVSRSLAFPHRTQHLSVGRAPAAVPQNLPGTGAGSSVEACSLPGQCRGGAKPRPELLLSPTRTETRRDASGTRQRAGPVPQTAA